MRRGDFIQTHCGIKMYPLDPRPEEIELEDIAHALSNICRFTGHCSEFYSVAQHSVAVSALCSHENAMWGLLHDASEAYICDVARPLKRSDTFFPYLEAEANLMMVIAKKFNLQPFEPEEVKKLDNVLLLTEARDLGLLTKDWNTYGAESLKYNIYPCEPKSAKRQFLEWYGVLINKVNT